MGGGFYCFFLLPEIRCYRQAWRSLRELLCHLGNEGATTECSLGPGPSSSVALLAELEGWFTLCLCHCHFGSCHSQLSLIVLIKEQRIVIEVSRSMLYFIEPNLWNLRKLPNFRGSKSLEKSMSADEYILNGLPRTQVWRKFIR